MARISFKQFRTVFALIVLSSFLISCSTQATGKYYGVTKAPENQVLRYISGSEPESLDPQVPTGQPEARVLMAIYDGLVEYEPKTMEAIPAIAESWEVSPDGTEFLFHLRKNATFSNGEKITAKDFVYTFRRGLSPELAAQNAYLAYYIKYGEAYNSGKVFVTRPDGSFVFDKDLAEEKPEAGNGEPAAQPQEKKEPAENNVKEEKVESLGTDTEFHKFINSPQRLAVSGDPFALANEIKQNEKLKPYFSFGKADIKNAPEFVKKVQTSNDGFSKFLQQKLDANVLAACANACDDGAKQRLADALNSLAENENFNKPEIASAENLPPASQKILKSFDKKNADIEKANAAIDEEAAQLEKPEEKEKKLKDKKKPIEKLFYVNRFLLSDYYKDSLESARVTEVKGENIGVEAIDDHTFRLKLYQPAPFFMGLLGHQFFRVVHQPTIEKFGIDWTRPENIVTSGAFKLLERKPYDKVVVEKDPTYWDAANVRLNRIEFYPLEESTTMMNLYKSGYVDAMYNHVPPADWNEVIKQYKDEYLNFPEVAIEYYTYSVKKGAVKDQKIREAIALAIDRDALAKYRKTTKPLVDFTPEGIFPKYEIAREKVYTEKLKAQGSSLEQWKARKFDPERARKLLAEAGFPVQKNGDRYSCPTFPSGDIELTYNTAESNKNIAEFIQAQWKQNLGIEVPLKNMEWKTFLTVRKKVEYTGMARAGWVGDYMDPYTFLNLFYSENNDSSTGWYDPKFDKMLDDANKTTDEMKRFEKLAEAEFFLMQNQPVIPLQTQATNWIKKPYVKGLYPNPGTLHAWKFVYIENDPNKWDTDVENIMKNKDPWVEEQLARLIKTQKDFTDSKKVSTTEKTNTANAE